MQHTKKLMLIEPKLVRPTIKDHVLSDLDAKIKNILDSDLADDIKAKYYTRTLQSYRAYDHIGNDEEDTTSKIDDMEKQIIASTPSALQYKAKQVIDHLKKDKQFSINADGSVTYKQTPLLGSNIKDLVRQTVNKDPSFPIGWREISKSLATLDAYKNLVSNPLILKEIAQQNKPLIKPASTPAKQRKNIEELSRKNSKSTSSLKKRLRLVKKRTLPSDWLDY